MHQTAARHARNQQRTQPHDAHAAALARRESAAAAFGELAARKRWEARDDGRRRDRLPQSASAIERTRNAPAPGSGGKKCVTIATFTCCAPPSTVSRPEHPIAADCDRRRASKRSATLATSRRTRSNAAPLHRTPDRRTSAQHVHLSDVELVILERREMRPAPGVRSRLYSVHQPVSKRGSHRRSVSTHRLDELAEPRLVRPT